MNEPEVMERVRALRAKGASPKVIARALGLAPAVVAPMVQAAAVEASGELQVCDRDVVGCWVSPGWSDGLTVEGHPEWREDGSQNPGGSGLAGVLVARAHRRGKVSACGFLVDVYCLGVKNVLGPKVIDDGLGLVKTTRLFFSAFDAEPLPAPLELAQHLILGAVEYARGLGFEPHPDFTAAAAGHLGSWAGLSSITFGQDGKPFYIQGPHDDATKVMRTLQRAVGPDNYDFLTVVAG